MCTSASAATARPGSAPVWLPTARASIAFSIWWNPASGRVTECPRHVRWACPASSRSAASGRTSAAGPVPATTVGARRRASAASAGGSVPTTASRAPSVSDTFSCITPASDPKPSTCAYPTFVITAMVGSMISRSRGISPGTLAPASTTSASASSDAPRMVSGTPIRLFRFPVVACTRYVVVSTARIISRVLVFPLEPVTATTGLPAGKSRRRARASRPRATSVSGTSKAGRPSRDGVPRRTTAAAAPLAFAWSRNAWASKRSPLRATNKVPGVRCRVSVPTPVKRRPRGPDTPKTLATHAESQAVTPPPRLWIAECGMRI